MFSLITRLIDANISITSFLFFTIKCDKVGITSSKKT